MNTGLPSPEVFTTICEAATHASVTATREANYPDLLAALALIKGGTEVMRLLGKRPDEIAEWLRRQAECIEQAPPEMLGPIGGRA